MIAKVINESALAMGVLKIAAVSLGVSLAATAVKGVFAAFTSLGPFGLIAGGIAAAAMVAGMAAQSAKAMGIMNDGVIGPGGITTMAGPAGVFELNPRDSVLATTNPISVNDLRSNTTTAAGGSPNLNVVVKNEGITNRAIQQLVDVEYQNPPGSGLV